MNRFRNWKELIVSAACLWVISLSSNPVLAEDSNSLTINGTFIMSPFWGTVAPDLAAIAAKRDTYTWTMTMHDLSYEYEFEDFSIDEYDVYFRYNTRVHATSFDFEFQGPDADVLNAIVGSEWNTNGFLYGAALELRHVILTNHDWGGLEDAGDWELRITTLDSGPGIHFACLPNALDTLFSLDDDGYPILGPYLSVNTWALLTDNRPGSAGTIGQQGGNTFVIDGTLPPPPPLPPTLHILDGFVWEGNSGTTRLDLTVLLSSAVADSVTVKYTTGDGSATRKLDYNSTSGTLTFQPGETSRTISVSIKGDRKREPNETFYVELSNAVGATISDGVATVTILNDD